MTDEFSDVFEQITADADASNPDGVTSTQDQQADSGLDPSFEPDPSGHPSGPDQSPPEGDPDKEAPQDPQSQPATPDQESSHDQQSGQKQPQGDVSSSPDTSSQTESDQKSSSQQGAAKDDPAQLSAQELSELQRKARGYDSMLGRLQKEQRERQALEQRLAKLEGRSPDQSSAPGQQSSPEQNQEGTQAAKADIPAELKDDLAEFQAKYADFASMIEENSDRGQTLRNLLSEYGPDMAAVKAESIMVQERLNQQEQAKKEQEVQGYWQRIASDHQDVAQAFQLHFTQVDSTPVQEFSQALNEWIESKPKREADRLIEIRDGQDADAAVQLISEFKRETGWGQSGWQGHEEPPAAPADPPQQNAVQDPNQQQASPSSPGGPQSDPDAAAAVPSRPSPPPVSRPSKDDFDGAWEEAVQNSP